MKKYNVAVMKKLKIYSTFWNIKFEDDPEYFSYDFYLLPMLRYLHHGKGNNQEIQFRWLFWGINFRIN